MKVKLLMILLCLFVASCEDGNSVPFHDKNIHIDGCNKVSFESIRTYNTQTTIDGEYLKSSVNNTGSMYPLLRDGTKVLVSKADNICINDLVFFNGTSCSNLINAKLGLHRVVAISNDENGIFYTTKGDNNLDADACKLRSNDIKWKVVGIFY